MFTFMVQARGIGSDEVVSNLGEGTSVKSTKNGCVWTRDIEIDDSRNCLSKGIAYLFKEYSGSLSFLEKLRDNGSDLTLIVFHSEKGLYLSNRDIGKLSKMQVNLNLNGGRALA